MTFAQREERWALGEFLRHLYEKRKWKVWWWITIFSWANPCILWLRLSKLIITYIYGSAHKILENRALFGRDPRVNFEEDAIRIQKTEKLVSYITYICAFYNVWKNMKRFENKAGKVDKTYERGNTSSFKLNTFRRASTFWRLQNSTVFYRNMSSLNSIICFLNFVDRYQENFDLKIDQPNRTSGCGF